MGEYAAVLAAACLTLEYGVSGAAVARSWGDKVLEWTTTKDDFDVDQHREAFFNPLAGFISFLSVVVLACGVQESKKVTNFFTVAKLLLVGVMIVGGFCLFSASNMTPLLVPSYGVAGVLRGATSSFFGYLGFDEVCCLASEAKNPSDTPKAVLYTLAIVTCIYILASVALSGMLPYDEISDTSGFPNAFGSLGYGWVANLTAFGEMATLPVVVLISLLAQPRLCAAMARDGLLPAIFCRRSGKDGNLFWSSILCGIPMTLLATFVPFSWMDDAISVGILFAFNMTNTALIVSRCGANTTAGAGSAIATTEEQEVVIAVDEANAIVSSTFPTPKQYGGFLRRRCCWSLPVHLGCYHFVALMAGLTSHLMTTTNTTVATENGGDSASSSPNWSLQIGAAALTLAYAVVLHRQFPTTGTFGDASLLLQTQHRDGNVETENNNTNVNDHNHSNNNNSNNDIFQVPMCPFLPLVGIYLNWYLISQLEWSGMILLFVFLVIISVLYCVCISGSSQIQIPPSVATSSSYPYSDVPHLGREAAGAISAPMTNTAQKLDADRPILLREMSMPSRRTIT